MPARHGRLYTRQTQNWITGMSRQAAAGVKLPWDVMDRVVEAACAASGRRLGDRFISGEVVAAIWSALAKDGYGVFPLVSSARRPLRRGFFVGKGRLPGAG